MLSFCRTAGEEFQHFLDKRTKREINALKVRCSSHKKGCDWVGELGALKGHLVAKDGCGYQYVKCPNNCKMACADEERRSYGVATVTVMRKDLQHHLKAECKERPYHCEYCDARGTYGMITTIHYCMCFEFPVQCPNKCSTKKIKRRKVEKHRKACPLEKIHCPFAEEGCEARVLLRKDEAEHMKDNVVNHQLLMLKSMRERDKKDKSEWGRKAAAIGRHLDSLLVTCTEEQQLPLQSIRSLIDDSFCLKAGSTLTLNLPHYSKYKISNDVWYSPPFYLGDIAGMKIRLAIYPNGIQSGAHTHMSLLVQNLKRDEGIRAKLLCGSYVQVSINNSRCLKTDCSYVLSTGIFCKCDNFDKFCQDVTGTTEGIVAEYKFALHQIAEKLCSNDILKVIVKMQQTKCLCSCHESSFEDLD